MTGDPVARLVEHVLVGGAGTVMAATESGTLAEIEAATTDFINTLDAFNRTLNGAVPSSETKAGEDAVPRSAAYAVAEAARLLRASDATRCAWRIDAAWLAVLAGDIDDIPQHVAWEDSARAHGTPDR